MFVNVDLLSLATNANYFLGLAATNASTPSISFLTYNSAFMTDVLGSNASARLLHNFTDQQPFHEAGVYNHATNKMYITSNYDSLSNPINITILDMSDYSISQTRYANLAEPNGGTSYHPPGSDASTYPPQVLYCDEGDFDQYSQLISVDPTTNVSTPILTSFLGRNFSSINDARQHPVTGDLWFTDADYGYFQFFRPAPTIPKQVYRFNPSTGEIQVVATDFVQSNGLEFSPDGKVLYVTDTGAQEYSANMTRPATIYAYDVDAKFGTLGARRVFAYVDNGFPDGIHTDTDGNVWAGCGDGVHVWSPEGVLLGKVYTGETANNFAFAPGKVFVFTNHRLWVMENVKAVGREVCKDFGECC
ncbi:calcium-dependent phosphotriesterase [Saccharata proteae CBS 121410]|uniref:Calcium-dependent phosphotriesterase n=1 Tax=Saccharata proteae CBS 121410 TaxID=1314787 RepID=A0A9P4I040_9PEZI|nr:calcium-dependent phosphotriesterase [Saccharata proteae CBS 121410]